jgi:nucleoside-diphosphate-sugar epimerase
VTGSTGFVGSHLVHRLASDGWQVGRLLRNDIESAALVAGVRDHWWDGSTAAAVAAVAAAAPDVVFHLASLFVAEHGAADVVPLVESNVLAGAQVAEAMLRAGCRLMVNTGTSWQRDRAGAYDPVCLYAATKQAFEDVLTYYVNAEGFAAITLRLYDTYGPDDSRPKLVTALRRAVQSGASLSLSPGEQLLDLVHVDDVTAAFAAAGQRLLDHGAGHERFDVSSGRPRTLRAVVEAFAAAAGRPLPVRWGERPYRRREVMTPPAGRPLPGWRAEISLEEGFERLVVHGGS